MEILNRKISDQDLEKMAASGYSSRSRGVEDAAIRKKIVFVVLKWVLHD